MKILRGGGSTPVIVSVTFSLYHLKGTTAIATEGCAFVQRGVVTTQSEQVVPFARLSQLGSPNESVTQNTSGRVVVEKPPVIPLDLLLPTPSNLTNGTNLTLAVPERDMHTNTDMLMGVAILIAVCAQLYSLIKDLVVHGRRPQRNWRRNPSQSFRGGRDQTADFVLAFPLRGKAETNLHVSGTRAMIIHWDQQVDGRALARRVFRSSSAEQTLVTEDDISDLFAENMSIESYHEKVRQLLATLLVGESFGLQAESFRSVDGFQVFFVLRLTDEQNLARYAMEFQYKMPFSNEAYNNIGCEIPVNRYGDNVRAFTLFLTEHQNIYMPFRGVDRVRLLRARIEMFLDLEELMNQGVLAEHFVAHDNNEVKSLTEDWGNPWRWYSMSLIVNRRALEDQIRNYFGEEVAWMFVWQRYCMDWLVIPAMIGGLVFFRRFFFRIETQRILQITFAIGMSIWATVFNNMYARYEARTRQRWGVDNVPPSLQKRPQYDPETHVLKSHSVRMLGDFLALGIIVLTALGTAYIMEWREHMIQTSNHRIWQNFSAMAVAIQILTLDKIWRVISRRLVDYENHKLQMQWKNSWVIKMCFVRIFTNLYPFIYVGLLKQFSYQGCPATEAGCLDELSRNLFFYFVARVVIHFGTDTVLRVLAKIQEPEEVEKQKAPVAPPPTPANRAPEESGVLAPIASAEEATIVGIEAECEEQPGLNDSEKHYIELQCKWQEYDDAFHMDDWTEQMLTFLFLVCFNVVLPSIAVVALLTTMLEARCMANRNCWYLRRPFPMTSPGIGSWQPVMEVVEIIAVLINVSFAVFTMQPFASRSISFKFAMFVTVEHLVLLLKLLLRLTLPPTPSDIEDITSINDDVLHRTFMYLDNEVRHEFKVCTKTTPDIGPRAFGGRKDGGYWESTVTAMGAMVSSNPISPKKTEEGRIVLPRRHFSHPAAASTEGDEENDTKPDRRERRTVTWHSPEVSQTVVPPRAMDDASPYIT